MIDNKKNIDLFIADILKVCEKHNYLPINFTRNIDIRNDYKEMRKRGIKGNKAIIALSEAYCTSTKNVEFILYGNKKVTKTFKS